MKTKVTKGEQITITLKIKNIKELKRNKQNN